MADNDFLLRVFEIFYQDLNHLLIHKVSDRTFIRAYEFNLKFRVQVLFSARRGCVLCRANKKLARQVW